MLENSTDGVKLVGSVDYKLLDANKNIKQEGHIHNLVVNTGCKIIASLLAGKEGTSETLLGRPSVMKVGSGSAETGIPSTPSADDLTLNTTLGTITNITTTHDAESTSIVYEGQFDPGVGTGAIVEMGIFNNDANQFMLNRAVCAVVNKAEADTFIINWTVKIQ